MREMPVRTFAFELASREGRRVGEVREEPNPQSHWLLGRADKGGENQKGERENSHT